MTMILKTIATTVAARRQGIEMEPGILREIDLGGERLGVQWADDRVWLSIEAPDLIYSIALQPAEATQLRDLLSEALSHD